MKEQQENINSIDLRVMTLEDQLTMETGDWKLEVMEDQIAELNNEWVINNGESEIESLKARVAALENINTNDNASITNDNINENTNENLNDNSEISPAVVLPEADKTADNSNTNDNLNLDKEISDKFSVLGISNVGDTVLGFFKEVWFSMEATFEKAVVFLGEVTFGNRVTFSDEDMGGTVILPTGEEKISVAFKKAFEQEPIITATASNPDISFGIKERSASGFTIYIKEPSTIDQEFSWIALPVKKSEE